MNVYPTGHFSYILSNACKRPVRTGSPVRGDHSVKPESRTDTKNSENSNLSDFIQNPPHVKVQSNHPYLLAYSLAEDNISAILKAQAEPYCRGTVLH